MFRRIEEFPHGIHIVFVTICDDETALIKKSLQCTVHIGIIFRVEDSYKRIIADDKRENACYVDTQSATLQSFQ